MTFAEAIVAGRYRIPLGLCTVCAMAALAVAQPMRRATVWDVKGGAPVAEQPDPSEFRGFACGSNGGPPRAPLTGWADFKRCAPEADGLREVYFEYDDELEYIARAHDNDREISRWAGTHEVTFPVITSGLFDDAGILKGIRMVTDARPEHKNDITEANRKKREEAYTLGTPMPSRFTIDSPQAYHPLPPPYAESPVAPPFC